MIVCLGMLPNLASANGFQIDLTIFDLPRKQGVYWVDDLRIGQKALIEFQDLCSQNSTLYVNGAAEIVSEARQSNRLEISMSIEGANLRVVPKEIPSQQSDSQNERVLDFSDLAYSQDYLDRLFMLEIVKRGNVLRCDEIAGIFPLLDSKKWFDSLVPVIAVNGSSSLSEMISEASR